MGVINFAAGCGWAAGGGRKGGCRTHGRTWFSHGLRRRDNQRRSADEQSSARHEEQLGGVRWVHAGLRLAASEVARRAWRTFIRVLDATLNAVRDTAKYGFPHIVMYGHERRQETYLAFRLLRTSLLAPYHKFEHSRSDAISQCVEPARQTTVIRLGLKEQQSG